MTCASCIRSIKPKDDFMSIRWTHCNLITPFTLAKYVPLNGACALPENKWVGRT